MVFQLCFSPSTSRLLHLPNLLPPRPPPRPRPRPLPRFSSLLPLLPRSRIPLFVADAKSNRWRTKTSEEEPPALEPEILSDEEDDPFFPLVEGDAGEEFSASGGFRPRGQDKDFDRDPEIAEIIGSCFDDPKKAQSRVEDRIRRKRDKILHTKTGSATPMKVTFNKFNFSNSYIWFEFYSAPLSKDLTLISDIIRSWHIVGRLGGCNSMNMQLSQAPMDNKRPSYDATQGANVNPTTFYNIGDLEVQDNLARIWVDIGITEPLLLDMLINALTSISSDYIGIRQVVFGGTEFETWKENLTTEYAGYSTHKI